MYRVILARLFGRFISFRTSLPLSHFFYLMGCRLPGSLFIAAKFLMVCLKMFETTLISFLISFHAHIPPVFYTVLLRKLSHSAAKLPERLQSRDFYQLNGFAPSLAILAAILIRSQPVLLVRFDPPTPIALMNAGAQF